MSRAANRAARLTRLRERLRERPWRVVDLARAEGVGRRSIERDLVTLADELGEAVVADEQRRYRIAGGPSGLNDVEALALYSAARLLLHTGVGERHYRSAMLKLARQLPEPARAALVARAAGLQPAPIDRTLDLVAQAWFQQRVLRCRYRSVNSGTSDRRDLEIYFVELGRRNHEAYALAYDRTRRRRVLVFKLARMSDVQLSNDRYQVPASFDPERALAESFGIVMGLPVSVEVLVDAGSAPQFQELADGTLERTEPHPDGSLRAWVRGTLDANGHALELVPWLVGWGGALEVVAPIAVREAVAAAHRRAAARYALDATPRASRDAAP